MPLCQWKAWLGSEVWFPGPKFWEIAQNGSSQKRHQIGRSFFPGREDSSAAVVSLLGTNVLSWFRIIFDMNEIEIPNVKFRV